MLLTLAPTQQRAILDAFERAEHPAAHSEVWARRSYAPGHIFSAEFEPVRRRLKDLYPDYVVAFDVVFESKGHEVAWHCDYESLGPFLVPDRWRAIRDSHFKSVHFNLTPRGGALVSLDSQALSYACYVVISRWGIFSLAHTIFCRAILPWFARFAVRRCSTPLVGNVFDNSRLHMVTAGAPRVSYVIRLIRACGRVRISGPSLRAGLRRSDACAAFAALLDHVGEQPGDAAALPWDALAPRERAGPEARLVTRSK